MTMTNEPTATSAYLDNLTAPLLDHESEQALARQAQSGSDEAREAMIEANLRLVVWVAKQYQNQGSLCGMSLVDLIQEGNLGLLKAVDKYDPEYGTRFSTYAVQWIRQNITRALENKGAAVRVPVHVYEVVAKLRKVRHMLTETMGVAPTARELADFLELPIGKVTACLDLLQSTASLDSPIGNDEDDGMTMGDTMAAPEPTAASVVEANDSNQVIRTVLRTLPLREEKVLRLRFGLAS